MYCIFQKHSSGCICKVIFLLQFVLCSLSKFFFSQICNYLWTPPESDSWEDWQKSWLAGSFIPSGHILISDPWPSFGNSYSNKDAQENIEARSWCCENSPYKFCNRFYKLFGDHQCTNQPTFVPGRYNGCNTVVLDDLLLTELHNFINCVFNII